MKINQIAKNIWEIEFDNYINISNYFKTTGDVMMKLDRIEKDIYILLQQIFDLKKLFKEIKKSEDVTYLETYIEDNKYFIKAKKSRARRQIIKKDENNYKNE